jgi:uncharacterized protein
MQPRDGYPPGVLCWVDTAQPDPDAACAFYRELFGWELEDRMPAGAAGRYYVAQLRGHEVAGVGSLPETTPQTTRWDTYVWVESADEAVAAIADAGGSVLTAPLDIGDAGRTAVAADPLGAVFCVWQAGRFRGAEVVNEPGTWNWSHLATPDPDAATAFYGRVFGWEAAAAPDGGPMLLRRPGYGDFLERTTDPEIRARQAAVGAPPGFEDAIGWLVPPEGAAAHWHVTFSIDDTDAAAERAVQLGGELVMPPTDLPWVRNAIVRDPQGATFTLSAFRPPE